MSSTNKREPTIASSSLFSLPWISTNGDSNNSMSTVIDASSSILVQQLQDELDCVRLARRENQRHFDEILIEQHTKLQTLQQQYDMVWNQHGRRMSVGPYLNTIRKSNLNSELIFDSASQQSHIPYVQNWESQVCQANHRLEIIRRQRDLMNYQAKCEVEYMRLVAKKLREESQCLHERLQLRVQEINHEISGIKVQHRSMNDRQDQMRLKFKVIAEDKKPLLPTTCRTWTDIFRGSF